MINLIINDKKISTKENQTILQIAKENNIKIKTLCFLEDCLNVNKCGVCLVEIEGQEDLAHSCSTIAKDNMVIHTNSEKVNEKIKENISKILDSHNFTCGKCKRRETCELLPLVVETKARASKPFIVKDHASYIDDRSKSIVLDKSRCIKCGRCVATCREKVGTNSIIFHDVNGDIVVGPQNFDCFDDTNCILCGQCVNVCPVDALYEKSHIDRVKTALEDPEIHVIVAMAPSVRTSLGELFKMDYGIDVTNKIYTALRKIGFDKKIWHSEADEHSVTFTYVSPDGEEGYPGTLKTSVTYTFDEENKLSIFYTATTDKDTICSLTNHSYFNLGGYDSGSILQHILKINSDYFTEIDAFSIPHGNICSVLGTPMDFTSPTPIGKNIDSGFEQIQFANGYDHNWILKHSPIDVSVYHPTTAIQMDMTTTLDGVQFYTGNFLDGSMLGKNQVPITYRSGFCLEAQYFPNAISVPTF